VSAPAIELREVGLAYRLARNRPGSVQELAISFVKRQVSYEKLWALEDVSLTVDPGELVAVVGPNGAGKTTLLKIVGRVLPPARGRVIVRGLVAPLIELGAGFNPELTGLENLVIYGALLGHDPRWMRRHAPEVADWAQLEDFMDVPVRSYSSGMVARLAFAVATVGRPDVLLVDEVLAVGDEAFRIRSQERLDSMIGKGTAVLLVTHGLEVVEERADRAVWLDHGRVVSEGDPREIVSAYRDSVAEGAPA
jgi:ABC-type polysaccharide/polyol phosphate transport system ATPase subunit